jgi:small subunit ribosomal protein S7e
MFTARNKIKKEKGKAPDELEQQVAQALFDLEVNVADLKPELRDLYIVSAREIDVLGNKKAVVVFVPFPLAPKFHKVQQRLIRELEKKFSGKHVLLIAQRRIQRQEKRQTRNLKQKRPRSRTLTAVYDAILDDILYPSEIAGKRTRVRLDGSKIIKIILDRKDQTAVEGKLDTFSAVYKKLTGREIVFEFPPAPVVEPKTDK